MKQCVNDISLLKENVLKFFIEEFISNDYDISEEFTTIKFKSRKKKYLEEIIWDKLYDKLLNRIIEKYEIDEDNEQDFAFLEGLEDNFLQNPDLIAWVIRKSEKKLIK